MGRPHHGRPIFTLQRTILVVIIIIPISETSTDAVVTFIYGRFEIYLPLILK